jgi:hypothetical protein
MRKTRQEKAHEGFEIDEDKDDIENLIDFLEPYGLDEEETDDVFDAESQKVHLKHLRSHLPEELPDGPNGAYEEIDRFYESVPRKRRAGGLWVSAESLLSMLIERLDFFAWLMQDVTRTCRGKKCPVYEACSYTGEGVSYEFVENAEPSDDLSCLEDRDVVNRSIDHLLQTADNPDGKVDPRRPAQAMLFADLVRLRVHRHRLELRLQQDPVIVEEQMPVQTQGSGVEQLRDAGLEGHPALEKLEQIERRIDMKMEKMGITPEQEMRDNRWLEEDNSADAELRAQQMAQEFLREGLEEVRDELPKGSQQRKLVEDAIQRAQDRADQDKDEDDS